MRRTTSWRNTCLHQCQNGRCIIIVKSSEVRMPRYLDTSTKAQVAKSCMVQYGRPTRSSWAKSVWSSIGRTVMGKAIWESSIETWLGKIPNWECLFVHCEKGLFLSVYVDDIKLAGKKQKSWSDVESTQQSGWFERTNIFPRSCVPGMYSETMWNKQRYCWQIQNHVRIANFRGGSRETDIPSKIFVFLHGLMIWRVMQRNVWSDIVSWQTRRLSNSSKYLLHASMTTTSKKKKRNLLENCHMYALK